MNPQRAAGKSGNIKITGEEKSASGSQEEVQMKVRSTFPSSSGMNFFLINKQISPTLWKPIYKSEIKAATKGYFEWNVVNVLSSDLAGEDVDREVKIEFY